MTALVASELDYKGIMAGTITTPKDALILETCEYIPRGPKEN
jgi:hypothetical protein